jgi:hypothetical protein
LRFVRIRPMIPAMSSLTYMIDGHRVELVQAADDDRWICDCPVYRTRASSVGPRCTHAWDAWVFSFTERLLRAEGVSAPTTVQ